MLLTRTDAADSLTVLANVYTKLSRHDDAAQLYESALLMRRRVLPPNHPSIGIVHFAVLLTSPVTSACQEIP